MKTIAKTLILATALMPLIQITARAESRDGIEWSYTAIATDTSKSVDVSPYRTFSAQAVYANGTPSTFTFTSGQASVATMTVVRPDVGTAKRPWLTITVSSQGTTGILTGAVITLNNKRFVQGTDWSIGSSSVATAKSISDAIDATEQYRSTYTFSGANWAVISASFSETGTLHNGIAASVSTAALTLSRPTFQQGEANGVIHIGTVTLTQGTDWSDGASTSLTATAIASAINSKLGTLVQAQALSNVVYATSTSNGAFNYWLDGPSSLTCRGFTNGMASDVSTATDKITHASHGLTTGMKVVFTTGTATGVTIGGLTLGGTYYAIRTDDNVFQLASSMDNAVAGTAIDLTSLPLINQSTYTISPIALAVPNGTGFYWSVSNDNVSFSTYTTANVALSSVTYTAAGSSAWDFGTFAYKYLKMNFKAPTQGGISLSIRLYGKKD